MRQEEATQHALDRAADAMAMIKTHEEVCTVRWGAISQKLDNMAAGQDEKHRANQENFRFFRNTLMSLAGTLLLSMFGIIVSLLRH